MQKPEDAPKTWIQFGKEIIDIETGKRFEATNKYFLTNPLPYKLGHTTETPNIDKIFTEWVGKDNVLLLKEIIAFCMVRDYPIHRIFCFIGAGSNGKSCFLRLLKKFIGADNVCSTELDTLLASRFEVTKLHKKLVCQMGETNFSEISKTSILKKLSGDDTIGFEYKNKNPFDEFNYAKILIATNNLPATTDKTIGFYRRWVIIDFPKQFTEQKDILAEIPHEEYENLGMQLIEILTQLLKKRTFHNEGSIEERQKRYEDKSDPLEKFIKENTEECYSSFIFKYDFEKKLNDWCKENRHREMSDVAIGKKMTQKGIKQEQKYADWMTHGMSKGARAWIGIKWKSEQTR
jgi:putative DNA primase/helicase